MKLEILCFQKQYILLLLWVCCSHHTSEIISNNSVIKMSTADFPKDMQTLNTYILSQSQMFVVLK